MSQIPTDHPTINSPLLALPPELRNMIYRHTLTSPKDIPVTSRGLREPGLLSTCKAIRNEAASIFYYENAFAIDTSNYSSDALHGWTKLSKQISAACNQESAPAAVRICRTERPNWPNFLRWLRRVYYGKVATRSELRKACSSREPEAFDEIVRRRQEALVGGLFTRVVKLSRRGKPWKKVIKDSEFKRVRDELKMLDWRWSYDCVVGNEAVVGPSDSRLWTGFD